MGINIKNMKILRSFMILGAVVVLTLFIYASYNSSRNMELSHMRNVAPAILLMFSPRNRNNSNGSNEESKNTIIVINTPKTLGLTSYDKDHHAMKSSNILAHHRQPTIDVEAVAESEVDADPLLEEHDLIYQQFSENNLNLNTSLVPLSHSQSISKRNKIVESDFLIPTSNLQKFIENADNILKNLTSFRALGSKQNDIETSKSAQSVRSDIFQQSLIRNYSKNNNNNVTRAAISTAALESKTLGNIDLVQGIITKQIYESGHRNEELNIEQICPTGGKDLKLLLVITSALLHQEARLAIRQTWGHYGTRRDVATLFVLGSTLNESINSALAQENLIYGDLIRGKFLDTYNNLTLKTISALEWVDQNCPHAKHILKTDDDMFINVPNLLNFLEIHGKEKRVIFGRLAKKWKPIRNKKSKYYVSVGQFAATIYPAFTTGPAYVMTSDIIHELYMSALRQTYLKLEDVFTTGIVAQQLGIKRVHANEFLNRRISFNPCNLRKSISVHMIKANEQFDLWKKLQDITTKCK